MRCSSMIEIIYSEDTNEKEEKCTDIRLPRNVRQIGKGNENKKIYVEDYVMTFTSASNKSLSTPAKLSICVLYKLSSISNAESF